MILNLWVMNTWYFINANHLRKSNMSRDEFDEWAWVDWLSQIEEEE